MLVVQSQVRDWLLSLPDPDLGHAQFHIDRLAEVGPGLGWPHTRHLGGKLWELRFHLAQGDWRIAYTIERERRIVLLTVFPKSRQRDRRQVERARAALARRTVEQQDPRGGEE